MSDADTIKALQRVVSEQERELLVLRPQVAVLTTERDDARQQTRSVMAAEEKTRAVAALATETAVRAMAKADAMVAAEREACAKIADEQAAGEEATCGRLYSGVAGSRARSVAAAIRARGGK